MKKFLVLSLIIGSISGFANDCSVHIDSDDHMIFNVVEDILTQEGVHVDTNSSNRFVIRSLTSYGNNYPAINQSHGRDKGKLFSFMLNEKTEEISRFKSGSLLFASLDKKRTERNAKKIARKILKSVDCE